MSAEPTEEAQLSCAACGKSGTLEAGDLRRCSACKMVAYCNVSCQRAHRREHRHECKLRAEELALDALPWAGGRPEPDRGIRGFEFMDNDDPQRYQTTYGSMHEKLWCEASELIGRELWDEAEKKVDELRKYHGGVCDMELEAKLRYGIAMHGVGEMNHKNGVNEGIQDADMFEMARQALRCVIQRDGGCHLDELSEKLTNLIEARIRALIPIMDYNQSAMHKEFKVKDPDDDEEEEPWWKLDYENAPTEAILEAAKLWLEIPKAAGSVCAEPVHDQAHDETHQIVEELAKRGKYVQARKVSRSLIKADPYMTGFMGPGIFFGAEAECSEALGESGAAHKAYVKLREYLDRNPSKYDFVKEFYHDKKSFICKDVPPGSLDERIGRTKTG